MNLEDFFGIICLLGIVMIPIVPVVIFILSRFLKRIKKLEKTQQELVLRIAYFEGYHGLFKGK